MTSMQGIKTQEQVLKMVEKSYTQSNLTDEEFDSFLRNFEAFECWEPYLKLLSSKIEKNPKACQSEYIASIKTLCIHLNRFDGAKKACERMVSNLDLSFDDFFELVLPIVTIKGDYTTKAKLLDALTYTFKDQKEQVNCLEQLCMIYDKKIFQEQNLSSTYSQILQLDPKNVKALRFFKSIQTQAGSWVEVAKTLNRLLDSVKHKQEEYRVAHELAGIYLYQLGRPGDSIDLLEKYRSQSPLDTSTILYDAFASQKNWKGCLDTLKNCISTSNESDITGILWYRVGQLHNRLDQPEDAFDAFKKSNDLWPQFLEPMEEMVHICVKDKNWPELSLALRSLISNIRGDEQKRTIQSMYHAVEGCLNEREA